MLALVVYDISSRDIFNNVSIHPHGLDCKNQSPKTIFMVLVGNRGNKSDLKGKRQRQVSFDEGRDLAEKNNMMYDVFWNFGKRWTNVEEIFLNTVNENEISKKSQKIILI